MGLNGIKKKRDIDIVFCIDGTSSMGPCIDNVRKHALSFYEMLKESMNNEFKSDFSSLRIQVITFRDLECDNDAMVKSEFFELPSDAASFAKYLSEIKPYGGGDYKESGLEAIDEAIHTNWQAKRQGDREMIVLFTDADAIDFGEKDNRLGYPKGFTEEKFYSNWYNNNLMVDKNKRLLIFAPSNSVYKDKIQKNINKVMFVPVKSQNGMADIEFEEIIRFSSASISSN